MVYKYQRKSSYRSYPPSDMMKAVEAVKSGLIGQNDAARLYKIPKSSLQRHVANNYPADMKMGRRPWVNVPAHASTSTDLLDVQQGQILPESVEENGASSESISDNLHIDYAALTQDDVTSSSSSTVLNTGQSSMDMQAGECTVIKDHLIDSVKYLFHESFKYNQTISVTGFIQISVENQDVFNVQFDDTIAPLTLEFNDVSDTCLKTSVDIAIMQPDMKKEETEIVKLDENDEIDETTSLIETDLNDITAEGTDIGEAMHASSSEHQCPDCPRRFYTKAMLTHHTGRHRCILCDQSFCSMLMLESHVEAHSQCATCYSLTSNIAAFLQHFASQHKDAIFNMPGPHSSLQNIIDQIKQGNEVTGFISYPDDEDTNSDVPGPTSGSDHGESKPTDDNDSHLLKMDADTTTTTTIGPLFVVSPGMKSPPVPTCKQYYTCPVCKEGFSKKQHPSFLHHVSLHTGEKNYHCDTCEKSFTTQLFLTRHRKRHKAEGVFVCSVCSMNFKFEHFLIRHQIKVHNMLVDTTKLDMIRDRNKHKCLQCGRKFRWISRLNHHLKEHADSEAGIKYKCPQCGNMFSCILKMKQHVSTVHNEHRYKHTFLCSFCPRTFKRKEWLQRHMLNHSNMRPWKCEEEHCLMTFKAKSQLTQHDRNMHSGGGNAQCGICGKVLKKLGLKIHMDHHTGEGMEQCLVCNKFIHKTKLKRHVNMHTRTHIYKCTVCQYSSDRKDNLKKHMNTHGSFVYTLDAEISEASLTDLLQLQEQE